nr:TetR/AcrR family transcriptional regulator [Desmospora activa]
MNILSAALLIVKTDGVEKLTLEAVAKEAGISKGGLLYHFPNKHALIKAMVEESVNDFVADIHDRVTKTTDNGRWSRAYLEATVEDVREGNKLSTALIATLFSNPELLAKQQKEYFLWQKNIENDGIDQVRSTIVRLAADGLWFAEIFGMGNLDEELREKVIRYLKEMTSEEISS